VFGSVSVTNCWAATVVGRDQVVPPSDEEMKPTLTPRGVNLGEPVVENCSKKSYRTPVLGLTTITFADGLAILPGIEDRTGACPGLAAISGPGEPGRAAECVSAQGRIRAVARGLEPVPTRRRPCHRGLELDLR